MSERVAEWVETVFQRRASLHARFELHAIYEDEVAAYVDAVALYIDLGGTRELVIDTFERRDGEGVFIRAPDLRGEKGGCVVATLASSNLCFLNTSATEGGEPAGRPRTTRVSDALPPGERRRLTGGEISDIGCCVGATNLTTARYDTYAIREDGSWTCVDATAFCLDMYDGLYLAIGCHEESPRGGVVLGCGLQDQDRRAGLRVMSSGLFRPVPY